jgi:hypothetical protein
LTTFAWFKTETLFTTLHISLNEARDLPWYRCVMEPFSSASSWFHAQVMFDGNIGWTLTDRQQQKAPWRSLE